MKSIKKVFLVVSGLSFCNGLVCMETQGSGGRKILAVAPKSESAAKAEILVSLIGTPNEQLGIEEIGSWLKAKKTNVSDKGWAGFVGRFLDDMKQLNARSVHAEKKQRAAQINNIIRDVALNLEPNHDCVSQLVFRVAALPEMSSKY